MASKALHTFLIALGSAALALAAQIAQADTPAVSFVKTASLIGVGFEQRIGSAIPLGVELRDELGHRVRLKSLLGQKPLVLVFAYYRCPNLCTLVLNGLVDAMKKIPLRLGADYRVLTVSIDPKESPRLASAKERSYLARYGLAEMSSPVLSPWRFLTGNESAIAELTKAAGFHFKYDQASREYSHPSGLIILTPQGKISQYLMGIRFDPKTLASSLRRASRSGLGNLVDAVLLFCFHYDPESSPHSREVMQAIRTAGVLSVLMLAAFLTHLFRKEARA